MIEYGLALILGYALGSIPFGLIATKLGGAGDVRAIGSGNIGATNVLRTGRKDLAALTLIGDAGKGIVAVLLVNWLWGHEAATIAGVAAFFGHVFPVWLGFKGGKGVATFIGILLALHLPAGIIFCAVWLGMAFAFRYSSLAALAAATVSPIAAFVIGDWWLVAACALVAMALYYTHRANIARLRAGTETKIGQKSPAASQG